jgi:hypothetical protein
MNRLLYPANVGGHYGNSHGLGFKGHRR